MKKDSNAVLVIVLGCTALFFLLGGTGWLWAGFIIGILSVISRRARSWILTGWFKLAHLLGYINSRILFTLVFGLILTPIGLLGRWIRRDKFNRKEKQDMKSNFHPRTVDASMEGFRKTW